MHLMELLDGMCHMESRFGLFRNSVSFGASYVQGLCLMHHSLRNHFGSTYWYFGQEAQVGTYHMLRNQFGRTQWNYSMTCVIWNLASIHL